MKSLLNARVQVVKGVKATLGTTKAAWNARRDIGVEAMLRDPKHRDLSRAQCEREWEKANPAPDLRATARDLKRRHAAEVDSDLKAAENRTKALRRPDPLAALLRPVDLGTDPALRAIALTMQRVAYQLATSAARQAYLAAAGVSERLGLFEVEAARVAELRAELATFYPASPTYDGNATEATKDRLFADWRAEGARRSALQAELDDLTVRLSIGATVIETTKPVTAGMSSEQIATEHNRHAAAVKHLETILRPLWPERFTEAEEIESAARELSEAWSGPVGAALILEVAAETGAAFD